MCIRIRLRMQARRLESEEHINLRPCNPKNSGQSEFTKCHSNHRIL